MDDLPVGGGGGNKAFSEHPDGGAGDKKNPDADLPLEKRVFSKTWSIRKEAFETLRDLFKKEKYECKNQLFSEHAVEFKKYLDESHPGALESALECFYAFADRAFPALLGQYQKEYLKPLVEKGLGAAKPNVKAKSLECTLLIFEVSEQFDEETMEALEALCNSKTLKTQTLAVHLLSHLMSGFGLKRFSPKIFMKAIEATAGSSNPGARAEAMNCYKSLFMWMGDATESLMGGLKDQQKDQLKKDFEELKKLPKGQHKKLTRTEKEAAKDAELNAAIAAEESKDAEVVDAFDIAAPVDILSKFNTDWIVAAAALVKWNERVEKMNEIQTAANVPKLAKGSYAELFDYLLKECKHANVNVQQAGVKTIGLLAKGLRQDFAKEAKAAVPIIMPKFKERKMAEDIMTTMSAVLQCIPLAEIMEFLTIIETEKAPLTKVNICKFLEQTVLTTYIDDLQDVADTLVGLSMKVTEEKDAGVRDEGLKLVGYLYGRLGDQIMEKYLSSMIPQKKQKVDEAKAEVKPSKYDKSKRKEEAARKKAEAAKKAAAMEEKKAPAKKAPAKPKAEAMTFDSAPANDDGGLIDDVAPPKKKPPPNIGKKPEKKVEAEPEEEKKEAPKKGPPVLSSSKPAASSGGGGGPGKPMTPEMVVEEDLGPGMAKETAIQKVQEFFAAEAVAKLEEEKWQERQIGIQEMIKFIEEQKPDCTIVEATCRFIKIKMKDWKESNINLQKEAINILAACCQHCPDVPKKAYFVYAPYLCDKIGDVKLMQMTKDVLQNIATFVSAKYVAALVMKNALSTKAVKNIEQSCNIIAALIEDYGPASMHLKNVIDFAAHNCNHANPAVRTAAIALFATLYKHMGEAIRAFLNGIKDSTLKVLDDEFAKTTVLPKGAFKGKAMKGEAAVEAASAPAASLDDVLPREDISKHLNAKLLKQFDPAGKDWKVKVKGCEEVQGILKQAKMRIKPNGLGELMDCLAKGMKESNKAVIKAYFELLGSLAECTGSDIGIYRKKCFVPMLANLADKQTLVRQQVVAQMDKWAEAIGEHKVIDSLAEYLTNGSPELREEGFAWIIAHKQALAKCEHKELISPLVSCLLDKTSKIRTQAEEVIIIVMGFIGFQAFMNGTMDLKPAVKQTVTPILQKAKQQCAAAGGGADPEPVEEEKKPNAGPVKKPAITAKDKLNTSREGNVIQTKEEKAAPASPLKKDSVKQPAKAAAGPTLKMQAVAPEDDGFKVNPGSKDKRAAVDAKVKWMHEELKPDQVERVKVICEQMFGYDLCKEMFAQDFNKHVKIVKQIIGLIETQPVVMMEILDVFFKWCYIKLTESQNTTLYISVFDGFQTLFDWLVSESYQLQEHEAFILIPLICEKSGVNNAILKTKVKALLKQCFQLYNHKKTIVLIIKYGTNSKNLKSVAESLEEIADFVGKNGVEYLTENDCKHFAKLADNGDKGVREGALQVLGEVYKILEEDIWKLVGNVTVKVKGLLEGRFKKVKPSLGASGIVANPGAVTSREGMAKSSLQSSFRPDTLQRAQSPTDNKTNNKLAFQKSLSGQKSQATIQPPQNNLAQSALGRSIGGGNSSLKAPTSQQKLGASLNKHLSAPIANPQKTQALTQSNFYPQPMQDVMNIPATFDDDDEDLREQINQLDRQEHLKTLDPATRAQVDEIMKHVQNLKYSELAKRVESLIVINEIIQSIGKYAEGIKHTANDLINAFTHVLVDIFERPMSDFPLRFAKYFVTIVNKAASCKEIMREVSEKEIYDISEQLLTRLLIDNLDKVGENKEGEFILKNLNASMLRMLENCNHTYIFCVLFSLLRKFKDYKLQPKLPSLIIKCLLKLSKLLDKLVDRLIPEKVLIVIHEYLVAIDHENKTQNDEMGIRIVKTMVNELVKVRGRAIWDSYRVIETHESRDKHIQRWIKIILNCQENEGGNKAADGADIIDKYESMDPAERQAKIEKELKEIFDELKSTDKFEAAIPKLNACLQANPEINLSQKMSNLSNHFQNFIMTHLQAYQKSLAETGSTPQHAKVKVDNWTGQAAAVVSGTDPGSSQFRGGVGFNQGSDSSKNSLARQRSPLPSQPQDMPSETKQRATFNGQRSFTAHLQQVQSATRFQTTVANPMTPAQPFGSTSDTANGQTDRINAYQSKLSSMREKFQQQKTQETQATNTRQTMPEPKSATPLIQKNLGVPSSQTQQKQNLGSSFSAMNNSLSKKWNEFKSAKIGENNQPAGAGMAATMITGPTSSSLIGYEGRATTVVQPSTGLSGSLGPGGAGGGASNSDLKSRLDEMKARLAAMKKQ